MKRDRIIGAILVVLGIIALILTLQIPSADPGSADPGSRLFPLIGSVGMIIFGFGTSIFAKTGPQGSVISREEAKRLGLISVVFIFCVISMKYLGFLITSPLVLYALVKMFSYGKRIKWYKKALFSIIMTILIWVLFDQILSVILPPGKLF